MRAMPTSIPIVTIVTVASLASCTSGSTSGSSSAPATTPTANPSHDVARATTQAVAAHGRAHGDATTTMSNRFIDPLPPPAPLVVRSAQQPRAGEEAGVGHHAVVGTDRLPLDVPARLSTSMVSTMPKPWAASSSRAGSPA